MTYFLGVDLGTTYSAAAVSQDGASEIFPLGSRVPSIPSVVVLKEDGTLLVGEAAERRSVAEPARTAQGFKRRLGDPTPILLGGTPYGADALSAALLGGIVAEVSERQGGPPNLVVVTHPANYGPYKLGLLEEAARLADVGDMAFLTEPEAAALHYSETERVDVGAIVAVYDFGGGTFDAAVLRRTKTGFEILGSPEGMERFGGIDLDDAVFWHVRQALGAALENLDTEDPAVTASLVQLRDECRAAKEALSEDTDATIQVMVPQVHTQVRITRAEFEDLIRPRLRDTLSSLERAIRSAGIGWEDLDRVLLVGGSSRIPLVGEMVRATSGKPVALDAHPKHTVALGAAQFARRAIPAAVGDVAAKPPPLQEAPDEAPVQVAAASASMSRRSIPYRIGAAAIVALIVVVAAVVLLSGDGSEGSALATVVSDPIPAISTAPVTTGAPDTTGTPDATTTTTANAASVTTASTSTVSEVESACVSDPSKNDCQYHFDTWPMSASSLLPPPALPGSGGASGSGCQAELDPEDGWSIFAWNDFVEIPLPDGVWFGYVWSKGNLSASAVEQIGFDISCFYVGDNARSAALEVGIPLAGEPLPYLPDNSYALLRDIPTHGATEVLMIDPAGDKFNQTNLVNWPEGSVLACPESENPQPDPWSTDRCGVWLYINDGIVTGIAEQWVPEYN